MDETIGLSKREHTEHFVQEVKKNRCLWDRTYPSYKDSVLKDNQWGKVGLLFSMSREDARKKWKGLRDRYVKEKRAYDRKCRLSKGNQDLSLPKWHLYKVLETFLGQTVTHRDGGDQDQDISDSSTSYAQDQNDNSVGEIMENNETDKDDNYRMQLQTSGSEENDRAPSAKKIFYCAPSFSSTCMKFKKRKLMPSTPLPRSTSIGVIDEGGAKKIVEMLDVANKSLKRIASNSDKSQDELDYYFRSLLERVRKLPSTKQRHARLKFETVLFEIEEEVCETVS